MNTPVILLATSETNKLDPLTETTPAPMIPLTNRPVMSYPIELLARQGFKHIYVSLYNMANQIETYFGSGQRWGIKLDYILQQRAWGTAGAVKWAEGLLSDTFIVMPADAIIDVDLNEVLDTHNANESKATVLISPKKMSSSKAFTVDPRSSIVGIGNGSDHHQQYYDTGVYIFDPSLLDLIPTRIIFDIHQQFIPILLEAGIRVDGQKIKRYWNPLETFTDYQSAQQTHLLIGSNGSSDDPDHHLYAAIQQTAAFGTQVSRGIWVGRNSMIHPSARIAPPVIIGDHCRLGRDVEIGPEVVIGSNVVADDGASIRKSTIIEHTYIGKLVNIDQRLVQQELIVNTATGESIRMTDPFLLGPIYQTDIGSSLQRIFDLVGSLGLLLFFSPFLTLIGLTVLLVSGRIFQKVNCQHDPIDPSKSFSRIRFRTRKSNGQPNLVGSWLETTGLHRIPELINVLKGDMTLVGVKPLSGDEVGQIQEDWQRKRFECRPGFTGLWYINTRNGAALDEVLVTDAYYAATRNWQEDFKLLGKTVTTWLMRFFASGSTTN